MSGHGWGHWKGPNGMETYQKVPVESPLRRDLGRSKCGSCELISSTSCRAGISQREIDQQGRLYVLACDNWREVQIDEQ